MNAAQLLHARALETPDRAAIVDRSARIARIATFAQLDAAAASTAAVLRKSRLQTGARVLVLHPVNLDLYVALAGLLRAGLVPTVFDPGLGRQNVTRGCERVRPDGLFANILGFAYAATLAALARVPKRYGPRTLGFEARNVARHADWEISDRSDDDAAIITFTSGSTNAPKIVARSHGVLRAQLEAIRSAIPASGVEISTMPIALLANLASGVTSVIPSVNLRAPGDADPQQLAADVEGTQATSIVASPAMLERLASIEVGTQLRSLRRIVTGGGPVMPTLISRLRSIAPQAQIVALYGSTEAEPIARLDAASLAADDISVMRAGAGLLVGCPVAAASVRIFDGEVIVAGDHVVPGYLDGVGDGETKLRLEGRVWHRTGDCGYFDDARRLWLTGRSGAMVRDARGTLGPFCVECALSFEPKIVRSALALIDGRRVVFIEARRGRRPNVRRLQRTLTWAHVDGMAVVRRIPVDRRHNAKVDYPALRRHLASQTTRAGKRLDVSF